MRKAKKSRRKTAAAGSYAPRSLVRWDADSTAPDGLTSMDVLLAWITAPGNVARWYGQDEKLELCCEVEAALHKEGIEHRDAQNVHFKVGQMLKQFAAADKWLGASGHRAAFDTGAAAAVVADKVLRMCPQYRELAPAMKVSRESKGGKEEPERRSNDEESDADEERGEIAGRDDSSSGDQEGEQLSSSSSYLSSDDEAVFTPLRTATTKRRASTDIAVRTKRARSSSQLETPENSSADEEQEGTNDKKSPSNVEQGAAESQVKGKALTKSEAAAISLDAVVQWLTTPGNVARWRESTNKRAVYREILVFVEERGIVGRKEDFVRVKLQRLEKKCDAAKQWLISSGLDDDYALGNISEDVDAQVEKICPMYRQLAAVLDVPSEMVTVKNQSNKAMGHGGSSSDEVGTEDDETEEKHAQPRRAPPPTSVTRRKKRRTVAPKADLAKRELPVDGVSIRTQVLSPKQERGLRAGPASSKAEQLPWKNLSEEERAQRRDLFELKRTMLQKELETKQARLDVQLVCDKMMARQKLLGAGVAPVEVDRALPL